MPEEPLTTKQHPVPQQVFGVQFKLVGNLTVRQFGILAICGFFAYVFFVSNIFILFRLLISGAFLLFGVGFAFVPVQDQPLDQWIAAFIRAIYAPTRRIWQKSSAPAEFLVLEIPKITRVEEPGLSPEESRRRLESYLKTVREEQELSPIDLAEQKYLESIKALAQKMVAPEIPSTPPAPKPALAPAPALTLEEVIAKPPAPTPAEEIEAPRLKFVEAGKFEERPSLASVVNFAEPVYKVQRGRVASYFAARRNVRAGRRLTPLAIAGTMVYAPAREQIITPELPEAPTLAEPVIPLPPAPPPVEPIAPPPTPSQIKEPPMPKPEEKIPPVPEPKAKAPAPLPVIPMAPLLPKPARAKPIVPPKTRANVIAGTVFDSKGGVLSNMLFVIKNEKGNVVRANKTNALGKFYTSPLPNGSYGIEIPRTPFSFATMKIELTGAELAEMEIRPKG